MPFDAPFRLGPFQVDAEGRLSPHVSAATSPLLLFRWRGRTVRAQLDQSASDFGRLQLQTMLSRVPSTASENDGAFRSRSLALLRWLPKVVPADWRLHLLADHRVRLQADRPTSLPITAAGLLTEITLFLLALTPYLDLLDETGLIALEGDHPCGSSCRAAHVTATPAAPATM